MLDSSPHQLSYATQFQQAVPRWLLVTAVTLLGAWLTLKTIAIARSPHPAIFARFLILKNIDVLAIATASLLLLPPLRRPEADGSRISRLAVFSSLLIFLNSWVIVVVGSRLRIPWLNAVDYKIRPLEAALLALVTGVIAAIRIGRSRGALTGASWAIIGIVGGGLVVGLTVFVALAFASSMSGFH